MAFQRTLLAEGVYHGKIVKQDIYTTKEEGEGTLHVGFDVVLDKRTTDVGRVVDLDSPCKRRFNLWLNQKNIERTERALRFLGFDDNSQDAIQKLNPWHDQHYSFVGKEVSLDITHQPDSRDPEALQESIWLNMAKKPLAPAASKEKLDAISELFSAYRQKALDKKAAYTKETPKEKEQFKYGANDVGEVPASMLAGEEDTSPLGENISPLGEVGGEEGDDSIPY